MVSLKEFGERALVRGIKGIIRQPPGLGTGDDSALIPSFSGDIVTCVDNVSFERHLAKGMSYWEFGWMAAAVSISDLAAMGAEPVGLLAAVTLPSDLHLECLYDIMAGMDNCAKEYGTYIYGGDTKFGCGAVSCTAIGMLDGRSPMMRSGAKPGNIVAVTGSLGSAAAVFYAIENGLGTVTHPAHLTMPNPRVQEGVSLSGTGAVTSCIDLSDGLAEGAKCICGSSHVGMDIFWDLLPEGEGVKDVNAGTGISKEEMMMYWGGEYELLFTVDEDELYMLKSREVEFTVIGKVTKGNAPFIVYKDGRKAMKNGKY